MEWCSLVFFISVYFLVYTRGKHTSLMLTSTQPCVCKTRVAVDISRVGLRISSCPAHYFYPFPATNHSSTLVFSAAPLTSSCHVFLGLPGYYFLHPFTLYILLLSIHYSDFPNHYYFSESFLPAMG